MNVSLSLFNVWQQAQSWPFLQDIHCTEQILDRLSIQNAMVNQYIQLNGFGIEQFLPSPRNWIDQLAIDRP